MDNNIRLGASASWLVAVVGLVVMADAFRRLLGWMLTTPEQRSGPAARSRRRGLATGAWGSVARSGVPPGLRVRTTAEAR